MKNKEFCPKCNTLREMEYITEISDEANYNCSNARNGVSIDIKICTDCGGRFIGFKERKNRRQEWHWVLTKMVGLLIYAAALFIVFFIDEYVGIVFLIAFLLILLLLSGITEVIRVVKNDVIDVNTEFDSAYEPVIPKPNMYIELVSITNQAVKKVKPEKVYKIVLKDSEHYICVTDIKCREQIELHFKLNIEVSDGDVKLYNDRNKYLGCGCIKTIQ